MEGYHPGRSIRLIASVVTVAYYLVWVGAVLALVAGPLARLLAEEGSGWVWELELPAVGAGSERVVTTPWGPGRLTADEVRATLELPIAGLPWSMAGVIWLQAAVTLALALSFLRQLLQILRRARAGAPFDASNAPRLRRLGYLLLLAALVGGVAEWAVSLLARDALAGAQLAPPPIPWIEPAYLFGALVLLALSELFRHGSELEYEQSLVV